jgi:hypothetical protein
VSESLREEMKALAAQRFKFGVEGDVVGAMSVLNDDPVFDLYPVGLRLRGGLNVRRYYERVLAEVNPTMQWRMIDASFSATSISHELQLESSLAPGQTFRLLAIMPYEAGRFTGERLFGPEPLFRLMFGGPIWTLLEPIPE